MTERGANRVLGQPRTDSPGVPDRRPYRERYDVELQGAGYPRWRGVSFETAMRVLEFYGRRKDVGQVKITRRKVRRR